MNDRLKNRLDAGRQDGFTLIELLIVIVILGILAGVVVFAVGGITDRGKTSACASDKKTLAVAQEAFYAKQTGTPTYAADANALKAAGLIQDISTLYTTTGTATAHTEAPISGSGCT